MKIIPITSENRAKINEFIISQWTSTDMVVRGKIYDVTKLNGFISYKNDVIVGLVTYQVEENECEIMSLNSTLENQGVGTALLGKVIENARDSGCVKVKLITTNDNINAIRYYQKRGFDMIKIYCNAVERSRKLKPSIPTLGDFGIPIKHEIEFHMYL